MFHKETGLVSHGLEGSKPHPSMASASSDTSRFLPCWSPCPDFHQRGIVMWKCKLNKPFSPQLTFWSRCCRTVTVTLRHIFSDTSLFHFFLFWLIFFAFLLRYSNCTDWFLCEECHLYFLNTPHNSSNWFFNFHFHYIF